MFRLKTKISTYIFLIVILFLVVDIVGYFYLKQHLASNHAKEQLILFSNIQRHSSDLLSKLLYKYSLEKEPLHQKHTEVLAYVEKHGYDTNLSEIHARINRGLSSTPYNIYVTDDNLVIRNTTLSSDQGFDLSFAQPLFENHRKNGIIGVSAPIFETFSTHFNSYSDSYLNSPNHHKILQVSYTYTGIEENLDALRTLIDNDPRIKDAKAYILFSDGYVGDFLFKSFKPYKPTLEEVKERINGGIKLSNELSANEIIYHPITVDGVSDRYKAVYFVQKSPIFDDAKIIYSVVFDEENYTQNVKRLNMLMGILTLFGLAAIYALYKIRFKESLLLQKDKFVRHSVHEIKTPLSIIALNNQMRIQQYGTDDFSKEIDSAIKVLSNSYDDMTFLMTNQNVTYPIESIMLGSFVHERVRYFHDIAQSNGRMIDFESQGKCEIQMSSIELTRLIDNNLSNAIKYSSINSTIKVSVDHNAVSIQTQGKAIEDTKKIFDKYTREVDTSGGFGLGLSIVKDIAHKYDIKIGVESNEGINLFVYTFHCKGVE